MNHTAKKAKISAAESVERSFEEEERLLDELFSQEVSTSVPHLRNTNASDLSSQDTTNVTYTAPASKLSSETTQTQSQTQDTQKKVAQQSKKETETIAFLSELRKEEESKKQEENMAARLQRLKDMRKALSSSKDLHSTASRKKHAIVITSGVKLKSKPNESVKRSFVDEEDVIE